MLCQPSSLSVNSQLTNHHWGDHPLFNMVKTTRAMLEPRLCPLQGAQETLKSNRRKLFWVQPGITFSFYLPSGRQICGFRFAPLCFLELLSRFHLDLHSSVAADTSLLGSQLSLISREGPEGLDMETAKMCSEHMLASKDRDRI